MLKSMLERSLFVRSRLQRDWWAFSVVWCLSVVAGLGVQGDVVGRGEALLSVVGFGVRGFVWGVVYVGCLSALGSYRPGKLKRVEQVYLYLAMVLLSGVAGVSEGWGLDWWYGWFLAVYGVTLGVEGMRARGWRGMTLRVVGGGGRRVSEDVREVVIGVEDLMGESDLLVFCRDNLITRIVLDGVLKRGGGLDTRRLLGLKMAGISVLTDVDEREGRELQIEFKDLRPSWFLLDGEVGGAVYARSVLKRILDVVVAGSVLVVMSPVLVVFALWVKLEDGGPVLYRQARVGRWGVEFDCIKLRSMRVDAERAGAQWAVAGDSRVTRVGRLMRKTRVDELPQLWSVLKGDMSMVGPRPERRVFVDKLKADVGFYDLRHSVKPGLTGWAQVRFPYGSTVEDAMGKHRHDLFYIKHMSFLFDVYILAETVAVVLRREGT